MTGTPEYEDVYARVIAKAWSDPAYKARLVADPHAALREMGLDPGADFAITVVEDSADTVHLVIPNSPAGSDSLSTEQMEGVAAGTQTMRECTPLICQTHPDIC